MSATYRADVDGLRALAVLPVVLYHAHLSLFSGGFVGVDVFFVISGFLITSLIAAELAEGGFSLAGFYERRIRRIFPALFTVLTFCIGVGWFILAPDDYRRLGKSLEATATFLSNVFFWKQSGYFATPASEMPLLHTWSLAVEEQFYVVFPLLMMALARWLPRGRTAVVVVLFAGSFVLSLITIHSYPAFTFYLAPTRAWELMLGALLALGVFPSRVAPAWRNAAGALGIVLILAAVFGYTDATLFPGAAAVPPSLGAALVIFAGTQGSTPFNRLLGTAPLVFIGKISYSLYLWHFPLFALGAYLSIDPLSPAQVAGLVLASFVLAVASWKFVEQPARRRGPRSSRTRVLAFGVLATCVMAGVGFAVNHERGFASRMSAAQLAILRDGRDHNPDRTRCFVNESNLRRAEGQCSFYGTGAHSRFVLWGDSHGEAMRAGFRQLANQYRIEGLYTGDSGCPPVTGVERTSKSTCGKSNQEIFDWIMRTPSVSTVVLAGRWAYWTTGTGFKDEYAERVSLQAAGRGAAESAASAEVLRHGLQQMVKALLAAHREVWIVGPTPEIGYDVPKSRYRQSMGIDVGFNIDPTRAEFEARQKTVFDVFASLAREFPQVRFVWPHEALCNPERCQTVRAGRALYYDDDHLSVFGAEAISAVFQPIFESMAEPPPAPDQGAMRTLMPNRS